MVRIINKKNVGIIANIAYRILDAESKITYMAEYTKPKVFPCIYVMWHGNQFSVFGIPDRANLNILISTSLDGDIVSKVSEKFGYKTCRGSSGRKGAVSGTLKMIEKLHKGENLAIMVDGPKGPLHTVKHGAIKLAREANVPIIPVHWYSENKTFVRFSSWDKLTLPVGPCWILNTYADPIYTDNKSDEEIAEEIKRALLNLEAEEKETYKEAKKQKLWSKK